MKRIVLFATALLLATAARPADAQFGFRGGVNLSKFVGQDATDEGRTGLNLGASIPLMRISALSIVPEVYYAQKGGRQLDPESVVAYDFEIDYIEVPVLAKLRFPLGGARGLHAYVAGGPAFAWNLNCRFSSSHDIGSSGQECGEQFQSFRTAMSSADRGAVFSGGLDFALGGLGGLNLDARMVRGLARVREDGSGDLRNQSFALMLGYYLGR